MASSSSGSVNPAQRYVGRNDAVPVIPPPVWSDADLQTLMEVTGLEQEGARELLWAHGSAVSAINAHFSAADAPLAHLAHEEESEDTDDDEDMHVRCLICEKSFASQLYLDTHRYRRHPTLEQLQRGVSFLSDEDELQSFGHEAPRLESESAVERDMLSLIHAAYKADPETLAALLKARPQNDVDATNLMCTSSYDLSIFDVTRMPGGDWGNDWPLLIVVRGASYPHGPDNPRTSDECDLKCAALLLENGSQVDVPFEQGGDRASDETQHQWEWGFNAPPTPLALACLLLDENMVMMLLHHGADPHRPYPYGFTMDDELSPAEEDVADRIGHHVEAARACWQGRGKAACSCPWHNWGRLPTSADGTDAAPVTSRHYVTAIHPTATQLPSVTPPAAAAAAPAPMLPPLPKQPSAKALGKRKM